MTPSCIYATLVSEGGLKTITLHKSIKDFPKSFSNKNFDVPNEIVAELSDYDAFKPHRFKRSRFSIIKDSK